MNKKLKRFKQVIAERKKLIIIVAVTIVVLVAGSVGLAYLNGITITPFDETTTDGDANQATGYRQTEAEKSAGEADKKAYEGDVEGATKDLDEQIKNTDDPEEKFVFQSQKATLLLNDGKKDQALSAAIDAHKTVQGPGSAAFVGQIAEEQGNKDLAREYYQKALDLIDDESPFAQSDRDYYQSKLTELGG